MKKNEKLLDAISLVDSSLIPELENAYEKPHRKWPVLLGALIVVVAAFFLLIPYFVNKYPFSPYVHIVTNGETSVREGIDAFTSKVWFREYTMEGVSVAKTSDLDMFENDAVIVDATAITRLPVYRNIGKLTTKGLNGGTSLCLSEEDINLALEKTLAIIGKKEAERRLIYVEDAPGGNYDSFSEEIEGIKAICKDESSVTVNRNGAIYIYDTAKEVTYAGLYNNYSISDPDNVKMLEEIYKRYAVLTGIRNPKWYLTYEGDNNNLGVKNYYLYEDADELRDEVVNHDLRYAVFSIEKDGSIKRISIYNDDCISEYMGDYPLITVNEARELLKAGGYYTSVQKKYIKEGIVSDKDIAKADIVYLAWGQKFSQPYYRFYVELDSAKMDTVTGFKTYGIFYVPAVSSAYLRDYNVAIEN